MDTIYSNSKDNHPKNYSYSLDCLINFGILVNNSTGMHAQATSLRVRDIALIFV